MFLFSEEAGEGPGAGRILSVLPPLLYLHPTGDQVSWCPCVWVC